MTQITEEKRVVIRRSRIEICIDILDAISKGSTRPTHIMYKANLSWGIMCVYLDVLQKLHLIEAKMGREKTNGYKEWELTPKGFRILSDVSPFQEMRQILYDPEISFRLEKHSHTLRELMP